MLSFIIGGQHDGSCPFWQPASALSIYSMRLLLSCFSWANKR